MIAPIIAGMFFLSGFIQAAAGFGSALVTMPVLLLLLPLNDAATLFNIVLQTTTVFLLWRYRHGFNWRQVWRIVLAAFIAIPVGNILSQTIPRDLALGALGVVLVGYSAITLYRLAHHHGMLRQASAMPSTTHRPVSRRWGYVAGIVSGMLSGAYNTGGPPLVMYGSTQGWPPATFKSNLQFISFCTGLVVLATHLVQGHVNGDVLSLYVLGVPAVLVGQQLAFALDRFIDPQQFRVIVLVLLFVLGLTLVF